MEMGEEIEAEGGKHKEAEGGGRKREGEGGERRQRSAASSDNLKVRLFYLHVSWGEFPPT